MIGETISHYRILAHLGSGGMGVVYEAEDLVLERKVAIKFLASNPDPSSEAAKRFRREARTLSALNHPNICTIYELAEHQGSHYIVQELLVGESFQEVAERDALDPRTVLDAATQIADGLQAAHAIGLVHRDIKPANLFLTHENRAKILDFGLASQSSQLLSLADDAATIASNDFALTVPGAIVGTLDYMSPEQLRGEAPRASSDIFSLGIVLYQLLNGRHPFKMKSMLETVSSILMSSLESSPNTRDAIRSGLDSVVSRMLVKDPEARYADGGELLAALRSVASTAAGQSFAIQSLGTQSFRNVDASGAWSAQAASPSIAVLPFKNLSADAENEYICEGLAEELVGELTRVEGLRVAAWNSSFRFRGGEIDVREAGRRIGVSAVLEGSLRRSGDHLRVNTKLLDVKNGYALWSGRYDSEMKDVFIMQEQMSGAIAGQLILKLGLKGKAALTRVPTSDSEAYNLYLKGRYFWNRRGPAEIQKALDCFEEAARKDQYYAAALAGIADCHVIAAVQGTHNPNTVFPLAREAATKALAVDPKMAEALASLACVEAAYDWRWTSAESCFKEAIASNPQYGTAHHWYAAHLLVPLGRFAEAKEQVEIACANDPLSMAMQITAGLIAYFERDPDRAVREYEKALEMENNFALGHYFLGQAREQQGSYMQAIGSLTVAIALSPGSSEIESALARAHALAGDRETAERMLGQLRGKAARKYVSPVLFVQVLLALGLRDEAIAELQRALDIRATDLMWLKVRPVFDSVRGDSRMKKIAAAIGLA